MHLGRWLECNMPKFHIFYLVGVSLYNLVRKFGQKRSQKFCKSLKELRLHFNACICWNVIKNSETLNLPPVDLDLCYSSKL